jgi:cytochrome P450
VVGHVDLLDQTFIADPYPWLEQVRGETPIFFMPEYDLYVVTRYRDMEAVLRDSETFSSEPQAALVLPRPEEYADRLPTGWPFERSISSASSDDHRRLRRLAQKAFTPKQANTYVPAIREVAGGLIDGFVADGRADLVVQYGSAIPPQIIAPIFGVPREMGPTLHRWALQGTQLTGNRQLSHETLLEYAEAQATFREYIVELVDERRRNPRGGDDVLTSLVFATDEEGEPSLTNDEIIALVYAGLVGGSETTATTINRATWLLLRHDKWRELAGDPGLAGAVVEETLRVFSTSRGFFRKATRDTELGGVAIPAGKILYLSTASANRDPEVFDHPDEFDLHRETGKEHLGFGLGAHFCLGAPLARVEARVALEVLAELLPRLRLSPDANLSFLASMRVPAILNGLIAEWDV